jgi:hypothetical protein
VGREDRGGVSTPGRFTSIRLLEGGEEGLARRLATILPDLTLAEAIETTRIHRVPGLTGGRIALVTSALLPRCSLSQRH